MHLQIRSNTKASPPDVEKFLRRLAQEGVNLAGAGGSNPEFGGEFAVALEDDQKELAQRVLDRSPKYDYRLYEYGVDDELHLCWLTDVPGQLHACIKEAIAKNRGTGRKVKDVVIGVQRAEGIPVQVFSEKPTA
jgi:hypothetical protein